ncbi:HSF5 protein, partial [Rhinopomastus cyanomelas]|nr:HSF5 protein [Rhinopomastus cyanomelas]
PASLNPDCFPAKLWQLVNNPQVESVQWDDRGEGLLIDEHLFLREVLEPEGGDSIFKTKSFPSFIRQLNLYGFHKVAKQTVAAWTGAGDAAGTAWVRHHFYSPHFKQHRPELLAHIKRLTKTNRAKL